MPYDGVDNAKLEQAMASSIQTVKVRGGKYSVNLQTMKQCNIETGYLRDVRRTELVSHQWPVDVSYADQQHPNSNKNFCNYHMIGCFENLLLSQ